MYIICIINYFMTDKLSALVCKRHELFTPTILPNKQTIVYLNYYFLLNAYFPKAMFLAHYHS